MHSGQGGDVQEVGDEVAIRDGVDAVAEDALEAKLPRDRGRIHRMRCPSQRARTER